MKTLFLDAGHGSIDPKTGKYTTAGKFFDHKGFPEFHNGGTVFYEGIFNRQVADIVTELATKKGIRVVKLYHDFLDTPLQNRTNIANTYHTQVQEGILFSIHSNAANTRARGYSVWTSIGQTQSDKIADSLWNKIMPVSQKYQFPMMRQMTDGDVDYEEGFHMVVRSTMPAVLIEHLFFDNLTDARLLMNKDLQYLFAEAIVNTHIEFSV